MVARGRNLISVSLLLFFNAGAVLLFAQEPFDPVDLSFSVYAPRPVTDIRYAIYRDDGTIASSQELKFRSGGRSSLYNYAGPREVVFFRSDEEIALDEKFEPEVVARARIPEGMQKALFVFMPASNGQNEFYQIFTIDDSSKAVPWGEIVVYNATSATLKGVLGSDSENPLDVIPGQNQPIGIAPKGRVSLAYKFRDKHWQLVYSENLNCAENERLILIIFPPRSSGARQLRGAVLKDYRVKEKVESL